MWGTQAGGLVADFLIYMAFLTIFYKHQLAD